MNTLPAKILLAVALILSLFKLPLSAQPNVVYIMADDLGWADISYHGSDIPTPHIDAFFAESVEMNNFMAWAVCSPTRAGLLTGIHPMLTNMGPETNGHLSGDTVTMSEAFKAAGYATGCYGKWHNGEAVFRDSQGNTVAPPAAFQRTPYDVSVTDHGFDEFVGFYAGGCDFLTKEIYGIPMWFHNDLYVPDVWDTDPEYFDDKTGYTTDLFADYAIEFIESNDQSGTPFFCYIPFSAPHSPIQYKDPANPDPRIPSGRTGEDHMYAEMIILLDDNIGRVLNKLDQLGITDNTIVVFTSDNGGTGSRGNNSPFSGSKHTVLEGGIHVPTAIRWPNGGLQGSNGNDSYDGLMSFIDVYPTIFDMCGLTVLTDPQRPMDGVSVWPALQARAASPVSYFFAAFKDSHVVRSGTHKYMMDDGQEMLYDLTADPSESNDIKSSNSALFNQLKGVAQTFMSDNDIMLSHVAQDSSTIGLPAPSGDILKVTVTKSAGNIGSDYRFRLSNNDLGGYLPGKHNAKHYLDYDIYVPNASAYHNAHVTLASNPSNNHRLADFGAVDQEGNSYKNFPTNGYNTAVGQWNRFRVGTGSYAPRGASKLHFNIDQNASTGTYVFYIDNAVLKNEDMADFVFWDNNSNTNTDIPSHADVSVTVETVDISTLSNNSARFISIEYPSVITPGMNFTADVTMGNTGSTTWTAANNFRLGSENPRDNTTWGLNRALIDGAVSVAPGQTYTFQVACTAPVVNGTYNMQWAMLQEGNGWFGETTSNESITVDQPPAMHAQFVSQVLPSTLELGEVFNAEVTMRNAGTSDWAAGSTVKLGAQNPQGNTIWHNPSRVTLSANVPSGANHTFVFQCTAPSVEGDYNFQRKMIEEGGEGWFGELSDNAVISVIPTKPTGLVDRTDEAAAIISSQHNDSPSGQESDKVFDNNNGTKYLTNNASSWVQHQFAGGNQYTVTWYTITSAADSPQSPPSGNIVLDSSFEAGNGWSLTGGNPATISTEQAQDGNASLKLSAVNAQVNPAKQTIALTTNTTYELRFWALNPLQTAGNLVIDTNDLFDDTAQEVIKSGDCPTWTEYVLSFYSGSETSVNLRAFTNTSFNGSAYVDNFSLIGTPDPIDPAPLDPASWALNGSNDGTNWTEIDSRSGITFSGRGETLEFSALGNSVAYEYYRLNMTSNGASILQLAEVELWGDAAEGDAFEQWKTANGVSSDDGDDDGDGLSNTLEFALGGDPNVVDSGTRGPVVAENTNSIDYTFFRSEDSVTYTIQKSTNLGTWTDYVTVNDSHGVVGSNATVSVPNAEMSSGKLFLRLKVEN